VTYDGRSLPFTQFRSRGSESDLERPDRNVLVKKNNELMHSEGDKVKERLRTKQNWESLPNRYSAL